MPDFSAFLFENDIIMIVLIIYLLILAIMLLHLCISDEEMVSS